MIKVKGQVMVIIIIGILLFIAFLFYTGKSMQFMNPGVAPSPYYVAVRENNGDFVEYFFSNKDVCGKFMALLPMHEEERDAAGFPTYESMRLYSLAAENGAVRRIYLKSLPPQDKMPSGEIITYSY